MKQMYKVLTKCNDGSKATIEVLAKDIVDAEKIVEGTLLKGHYIICVTLMD